MKKKIYSTREVAEQLGCKTSWLSQAVYMRAIPEPRRGPGRFFLWTPRDIQKALELLNGKPSRVKAKQ
jgi:hypothetical protein